MHYLVADREGQERWATPGGFERTPEALRRLVYHTRSLRDWYLELDLGRVVPVQKVVLRYLEAPLGDPLRQVRIRDSQAQGGWQEVDPGEATALTPSTSLTLVVSITRNVIQDLEVTPRILSPNGDGAHDEAVIRFALPSAVQDRHAQLVIHDLAGRRVRLQEADARGIVRFTWDGRDDEGHLVAPGL